MPEVSFANTWEIGTPSMVVWEFGTVTSLAGDEDLGVRASIASAADRGAGASLEDVWMVGEKESS